MQGEEIMAKGKYIGFKGLTKKIEDEGKSEAYAKGTAAKIMRNKYEAKDIKAHQKSGTSMRHVKPKKGK